jgi:hypothetical protein
MMYKSAIPVLLLLFSLACGKSSNPDTSTTQPAASSDSSASSGEAGTKATAEKGSAAQSSAALTVPAGTVITVRLGETLSSKTSQEGQGFSATVAQPVAAHPLGRFKGGALLEVRLNSVNVNGSDMNIRTSAVARSAKGKGKRSLVMAGGGAGLGALIGGLAGGGKGAAIGALAGGGAGTAGAAFTGNKDIVLPAESALTFKLTQPLEVKK